MVTIDAHQHFWDPATADYPWMSDAVAPLCRRFGPDDLAPLLAENSIDQSIIVQARSDLAETYELIEMAGQHAFIGGVVGWIDLTDAGVGDVIDEVLASEHGGQLVGVRHQAEDEPDPGWLARDDVSRGLRAVADRGLTYDLLVKPPNLESALVAVDRLPEARFVIDHMAKPLIRAGELEPWETLLGELARRPNVWCKLSGIITEADHQAWKVADIAPYVERVYDMFGADRLLFGSDWPVVLLAGTYGDALSSTIAASPELSASERAGIMGANAVAAYRLGARS